MKLTDKCNAYIKNINKIKVDKIQVSKTKARNISAYNAFCMENRKSEEGTPVEIMKSIGEKWRNLSDKKKETYVAKAKKLNEKAQKEFEDLQSSQDAMMMELYNRVTVLIKEFKKEVSKRNTDEDKVDEEVYESDDSS